MSKDTIKEDGFHYFQLHKKDVVLFNKYVLYIQRCLEQRKPVQAWVCQNLINLLSPKGAEEDEQSERRIKKIASNVVRYFKNDKEYYFKFDKEKIVSFELMIHEVVSSLIFYEEVNIIENERDEYIRQAYQIIFSYTKRNKVERRTDFKYGYMAIACYVALEFGFHITGKKENNANLFQKARNAFKPKKTKRKIKKPSS